ncbi:hypothetical protein H1Z61_08375 [Bacillus aquiflavi]|uniref:DUF6884 domain-containing protein n=1 Tax=Bacillus aquiflavi TaxID=2672567 RepID=A0A6B3W3B7_9BACI|nr:DUF6884 domain-containing protein [Bacillus aquiflavi]MBA4537158.1 hypothetical protein [Bacillus aquiflavi]NEY82433.1 hypothetical protein [Bacillus aquiflavi]UAC49780.1 hypothetical protein K6959_08350 [Bacillus aquiflavi]
MKQLCIIPCGKRKIWDKQPDAGEQKAQDSYIGTFHQLCQQYARLFFTDWVIISAKHGFLLPNDIVPENYDLSFSMKKTEVIGIKELQKQIVMKGLSSFEHIVVLGGKKFKPIVESAFGLEHKYTYPLDECGGLGYMQRKLKLAIQTNKAIHTKS